VTRRIPIVATIVVLLAVALMVRLGVWQLHRLDEKQVLLARYGANLDVAPIPLQSLRPVDERALYRRVTATCPGVVRWQTESGRSTTGATGWRHIAWCDTGAEGPGLAVDVGNSQSPEAPKWSGGTVTGRLIWAPTGQPLITRLFGIAPRNTPMVISESAAPGLLPTAQPDPATVPNNHLSYAIQWFLFAGIAAIIYAIALWRRSRSVAPRPPHR
jgi:surfeit locus 1 family protein